MNLDSLLDLIFPVRCVGCGDVQESREVLCPTCREKIPMNRNLFCGTCEARLPEGKKICHLKAPYVLGAATSYGDDRVRALVALLKFKSFVRAAGNMADILTTYLREVAPDIPEGAILVPVPLHARRLRERGFNQAELIAKKLGERLSLACETTRLRRVKSTFRQSDLSDLSQRRANVEGAFEATAFDKPAPLVVLVDDVVTSGATLSASSRALKIAGARRILAVAFAKA